MSKFLIGSILTLFLVASQTEVEKPAYLIYAQTVKDATMAHFILLNMGLNDRLLHLNGSYHSNNREGIIWFIENQVSGYDIVSINTILVDDPFDVERDELAAADYTIVIPRSMTRTY